MHAAALSAQAPSNFDDLASATGPDQGSPRGVFEDNVELNHPPKQHPVSSTDSTVVLKARISILCVTTRVLPLLIMHEWAYRMLHDC